VRGRSCEASPIGPPNCRTHTCLLPAVTMWTQNASFRTPIPGSSGVLNARLSESTVQAVVASEVASVQVIDLHTHLLPPSHGPLCLWGIDELLTYVRSFRKF
jgi:hypothetical protein